MRRPISGVVLSTFACLAFAGTARASEEKPTGIRGELLLILGFTEKRVGQLLEAIPQEKLAWRPAEGVRSASEIFMHIALSPYFIGGLVGVPRPEGIDRKLEKSVTDKAQIQEHLTKAFAHTRKVIGSVSDADLDKTKKAPWGMEHSNRFFLMILPNHAANHLAQLGIYARSNGIEPPWIAEQRKKMAERKKKASEATEKKAETKEESK